MFAQIIGFIISLISFFWFFVALIPFLGWLNWLNIPLAILGLVLSLIGTATSRNKGLGIAGIVMSGAALVFGLFRLHLGCGII